MKQSVLAILLFVTRADSALSEIVSYRDDRGRTHFVDSEEKVPERYRKDAKVSAARISKVASRTYEDVIPSAVDSPRSGGSKLQVYVTNWCPYCKKLESYLKEKNISYQRLNIETDERAKKTYAALGMSGVPITVFGKKRVSGFKPEEIDALLKK